MTERYSQVERAIRAHIAAFNARDLPGLLAGFADDAVWHTGQDTFRGRDALAALFGDAFQAIAPHLTIRALLIDGERAACELVERMTVDGVAREDVIAGFYQLDANGLITVAKIYREGSADV